MNRPPSPYRSRLIVSTGLQVLILSATALAMDGGSSFATAVLALVPYWLLTGLITLRRHRRDSRFDFLFVVTGYPILFGVLLLLRPLIHR